MSKKKTHEEYVAELKIKNPNLEVVEEYINSSTPILHRCKIDGYEWYVRPNNILSGKGCPKCYGNIKKTQDKYIYEVSIANPDIGVLGEYINAYTPILHLCKKHNIKWYTSPSNILQGSGCCECLKEKIGQKNRKTHEQYIKDFERINKNIEIIGTYIDSHTPILFRCKIDGYEWYAAPSNILFGKGCPKCAGNIKKTHEQYLDEVFLANPDIEVIEKYINANTPILHRCKKHNVEWNASPTSVLQGKGCYMCGYEKISDKFRKTKEQYIIELSTKNPNIEILGEYFNNNTPTLHRCLIHNVEWMASPSNVLLGGGCRECRSEKIGDKLRKSHEKYVEELKLINLNIVVIDEYVGAHLPILHRCLVDGYEWEITPHSILLGHGCPKCCESKGEKKVGQWLNDHKIQYISQKKFDDCKDKYSLPFDFYLPEFNCCVEYDGKQHFEAIEWFGGQKSLEYTQKHDAIKNKYCKDNNIKLLRIPYFKNIEEELNNFLFI